MTATDIARKIFEQIRDNAAVLALCREKFQKNPRVELGMSGRNAPLDQEAPAFTVLPAGKSRGEEANDRTFDIKIICLISLDDKDNEKTVNGVLTREHEGSETMEQLLDLVMDDLRNVSSELTFFEKRQEYEAVENRSFFVGTLDLGVSFPVLIGGYEPTIT
jgi:hypothetical protein